MSGLKFTFSGVTLFLPDNLPEVKKVIFKLRQPHEFSGNEHIQIVSTIETFLEVAIESWSE